MYSAAIFLVVCVTVGSPVFGSILDTVDWQPVFRVDSGSGLNVYDLWAGNATLNVTGAYKTELANTWTGVKKVKFAMIKDNVEVMTLMFDGRDTDRMSWFTQHSLISSSPYQDLRTEEQKNYFSISGMHTPGEVDRRFYINRNSGGCTRDKGWIAVVDSGTLPDTACSYELYPTPVFLYSRWTGYAQSLHYSRADAMIISVEADDPSSWDMVFRATPGVEANIFRMWTSNDTSNMDNEEMKSTSAELAGIFKSERVNSWNEVTKVKVAMYQNGVETMYMTFDATDADRTSWFSAERLISSSFTDILDYGQNFFSITGHSVNGDIKRRFYVMKNYASYCVDNGWMAVVDEDSANGCQWDKHGPNPAFLYSAARTYGQGSGFARADVFAIYFNTEPTYLDFESYWTRERSGCQCYFDSKRSDCACCIDGGCQCTSEHHQQCVQCGYNDRCGLREAFPGAWTGSATCACPDDPSDLSCACCYNNGCQCAKDKKSCTQCGREDLC